MANKPKLTVKQQLYEAKIKVVELFEDYCTQLYFETMPEYDPLYCYSYQDSNRKVDNRYHSVTYWLRAVQKHMNLRRPGHGGGKSNAAIINITNFHNQKSKDMWLDYETRKLKKKSRIVKKTKI